MSGGVGLVNEEFFQQNIMSVRLKAVESNSGPGEPLPCRFYMFLGCDTPDLDE